jgi:hypothetical protein
VLAAAQRAGTVNPEQVAVLERALEQVDRPGYAPEVIADAEATLTGYAEVFGPRDLRRIAVKLVDVLDPDGTLAADRLAQDRRHLQLTANRDGTYTLTGRLTGTTGAALQATLSPLAKPRPDTPGHDRTVHGHEDGRTYGQRLHDALDDACGRLLRSGGLPDSGGTPATVIVTISAEDLTARTGTGETSDGTLIPAARLLELANEAQILPAVLTAPGECLLLGRSRRIASRHQTYALIARDGGCSFPGLHASAGVVRPAPHPRMGRRRHHRPGQPDAALPLPPHPLRQPRLDLPHHQRHPRMDPTPLARQTTTTPDQQPHQTTPPQQPHSPRHDSQTTVTGHQA